MATSTAAQRPNRHHNVDPDDAMAQRALALAAWAKTNARAIIAGAVVVLVVVLGLVYYRYYEATRAAQAAVAFAPVAEAAETGAPTAEQQLRDFTVAYAGSAEADLARVLLGRVYLREGRPQDAVTVLQEAAGGDSEVAVQAMLVLGAAQHQAGQADAAVETFRRAAGAARLDYLQREALQEAALVRQAEGQWAAAVELWTEAAALAEEGSIERGVFEMRRAEAEAMAARGAGAQPAP